MHVRAGLDEVGRQPQGFRRRVRVLEAPRVGDDGDVERFGDVGRQRHAEWAEDVAQQLAGRRGLRVDEVDVAEARVVVVMVDVHHEGLPLEQRLVREARRLGAVDRHQHALHVIGGPRPQETA